MLNSVVCSRIKPDKHFYRCKLTACSCSFRHFNQNGKPWTLLDWSPLWEPEGFWVILEKQMKKTIINQYSKWINSGKLNVDPTCIIVHSNQAMFSVFKTRYVTSWYSITNLKVKMVTENMPNIDEVIVIIHGLVQHHWKRQSSDTAIDLFWDQWIWKWHVLCGNL